MLINGVMVVDPSVILDHVCSFFSSLLAAQPPAGFSISPQLWQSDSLVSSGENADLMLPLSEAKIDEVVPPQNRIRPLALMGFLFPSLRNFGLC